MINSISHDIIKKPNNTSHKYPNFNPIYIITDSNTHKSTQQIRQLANIRNLITKPSNKIIKTPITTNFHEKLSILQYFISTHNARKNLTNTTLKTANSKYLTRHLINITQDTVIAEFDYDTIENVTIHKLEKDNEIIKKLTKRILNRMTLDDVYDPINPDKLLIETNSKINETIIDNIEATNIDEIKIHSPLTYRTHNRIYILCYGHNLTHKKLININKTINIIATQSINKPNTQLTMRTFHINNTTNQQTKTSTIENHYNNIIQYQNLKTIKKKNKTFIIMNQNNSITIIDNTKQEREQHTIIYNTNLHIKNNQKIKIKTLITK